ncbi:MAG TPA: hypothetical protein PLN52_18955, partial [Opitutaceae bacterium]|nr:hypothetical protein [Opitutaceae bacterium]
MNTLQVLGWRRGACSLLVLLSALSAKAQQVSPADDAATLRRYDANNNGRLDSDELSRLRADEARRAGTPTEGTGASPDEVIALSPYAVVSDDRGYQASNTLSGTRLNSKLEDLGASITVVTKQQMLDTAVLDINDVLRYEASTEG